MPDCGLTKVVVNGLERYKEELREELAATAVGKVMFTLAGAAPDVWSWNDDMVDATMEIRGPMLVLEIRLLHDRDALDLCGSLARRHPSLHFDGLFECGSTFPDFTVRSHSNGVENHRAHFDVRLGGTADIAKSRFQHMRERMIREGKPHGENSVWAAFGILGHTEMLRSAADLYYIAPPPGAEGPRL